MADQDQPTTCGQGLARNAIVPTLLAEVAARLAERLRNARVVAAPDGDTGKVAFGATVHVVDADTE